MSPEKVNGLDAARVGSEHGVIEWGCAEKGVNGALDEFCTEKDVTEFDRAANGVESIGFENICTESWTGDVFRRGLLRITALFSDNGLSGNRSEKCRGAGGLEK